MIIRTICFICLASVGLFSAYGYNEATRDPEIRTLTFNAPHWPSGERPVRLLLMSDPHVEAPETPPQRLSRIVVQANALHPDLVVIAGDFLGTGLLATKRYTVQQAVAPFRRLKARLGVFAVLGNHDQRRAGETINALKSAGITVLDNDAVQTGPIGLVGLKPGSYDARRRSASLHGAKVLVAHSPDEFPKIRKGRLMLAGHTHCGQIVLPLVGALATGSQYGTRYFCGLIQEPGKTLVVTAGLGTSTLPMRIGAPPDMWLVTIE